MRVDLDPDHWLGWGLPGDITAWVGGNEPIVAAPPVQVAARLGNVDQLHRGGLLWPEAAARLARTAYVTREAVGRGQVILILGEPAYRGWMKDTERLLLNAFLYGPGMGTEWSAPW